MNQSNKSIVHIDLDSFFVSCERLLDRRLYNKPVLIGGTSDRGVVAACSYEARAFGIHSAMPMKMARQLCPESIVIRGNSGTYSKFSDMITDVIKDESPLYEKSSIDEFYIDVSGMDHFFGCYRWAKELRRRIIRETHLPISFGLSTSKTVSKITTNEAKPNGELEIPAGTEKPFLAPLSVKKIPMVGEQTYKSLKSLGVKQIKTLQEMPMDLMDKVMGKSGVSIWKKAQGIDNTPVIPYRERKSISLERTFEKDTTDYQKLKTIVTAMAENLAFQLRNGNKLTACITLKIRYADFQTCTKQIRTPYTSLDHVIISKVHSLFEQLYNRRVLVRLVGVRMSHLVEGGFQMNMFEDDVEILQLYKAMDHIRKRFGQDAIKRAVTMESKGLGRSNPFNGQPPIIPAHRRA